jgi:hypothetical protein
VLAKLLLLLHRLIVVSEYIDNLWPGMDGDRGMCVPRPLHLSTLLPCPSSPYISASTPLIRTLLAVFSALIVHFFLLHNPLTCITVYYLDTYWRVRSYKRFLC